MELDMNRNSSRLAVEVNAPPDGAAQVRAGTVYVFNPGWPGNRAPTFRWRPRDRGGLGRRRASPEPDEHAHDW